MIRLYKRDETNFANNGIGILKDVISCTCSEVLNGKYDLEFEYPIGGAYVESLVEENVVKAPVGNQSGEDQLFRIKLISKQFKRIKVYATHIFYDLADNFLEDVAPTGKSGDAAIKWIRERTVYKNDFVASSDITKIATARYVRKNFVDALIGTDNSFLNTWGGELYRNNKSFAMNKNKGLDRGVQIRYGKNMKEITWDIDITGVVTRIYPQGFDGLMLPEKYIDSPLINNYINPKIKKMEFTDIQIDEENGITEEVALEQLREITREQYKLGIDKPTMTIQVDFLELSKIEEYKQKYSSMEKIYLGDYVEAIVPHLNLKEKLKVVSTKYDVLAQKYIEFELTNVDKKENNFINNTKQLIQKLEKIDTNILGAAKNNATNQIVNALGGHVYKTRNELFIMDSENPNEAVKVWRWNINGLGYSSTGIGGPYGIAITADGQIVADYITTGKLNTNLIEGYGEMLITVSNIDSQVTEIKATSDSNTTKINNVESDLNNTNSNLSNLSEEMKSTISKVNSVENELNTTNSNVTNLSEVVEETSTTAKSALNKATTNESNITKLNTSVSQLQLVDDEIKASVENVTTYIDEQVESITLAQETKYAEIDVRTDAIESSISAISEITTTTSNNYQDLSQKFNDYTPTTKTTQLEQSLSVLQTNTYTKTEINTKLTDGSVTKVRTVSGTFDENGMHYAKTNAPTSTTINEVGVGTKKSDSDEYVLFAGYVDDSNTQYEKYKGQTIVVSENMLVSNYLVIGENSRLENYEDGTGIFVL